MTEINATPPKANDRGLLYFSMLLIVFVLLEIALIHAGRYVFLGKSMIVPVLLIFTLLTRRFYNFVFDWSVFIALTITFDTLRGLIYRAVVIYGLPVYSHYVIYIEQWFTPGTSLSGIMQSWNPNPGNYSALEIFSTVIYALHFVYFLVVGFCLWLWRREAFWSYQWAFVICMYAGLLCYLLFPTTPPFWAAHEGLIPHVLPLYKYILNLSIPGVMVIFDLNPIAAMPSLHAAFPTLVSLILFYHFGPKAWPGAMYTLLVYFSCVLVGAHYIFDIVVGASLFAALPFYLVYYRWPKAKPEYFIINRNECLFRLGVALIILMVGQATNLIYIPNA